MKKFISLNNKKFWEKLIPKLCTYDERDWVTIEWGMILTGH